MLNLDSVAKIARLYDEIQQLQADKDELCRIALGMIARLGPNGFGISEKMRQARKKRVEELLNEHKDSTQEG